MITRRPRPALLVALLLVVTAAWGGAARAGAPPDSPAATAATTWVVDAVDDQFGNRWLTQGAADDRDAATTTIAVGDTVEWRFDRAAQEHDLTSRDSASTWADPLQEYRVPGGAPIRRTFTEPGTYEYLCAIHGVTMRGTVVVTEPGNTPPTASPTVEPLTGPAPLPVHLTAAASDPDDDPLTYRWDTGDGRVLTTDHAMHSYERPGTYAVTLEVSDGRGGVHREAFSVTVTGEAAVTAVADRTSGPAPLTVRLTGSVADEHQGSGVRYRWDLDDGGAPVAGRTVTHQYDDAGSYTATLEVTDAGGVVGTDSVDLLVGGGEPLPQVTASATPLDGAREVGFSAGVRTAGEVTPYAAGTDAYPDLTGLASMARGRGSTVTTLRVAGLKPGAAHLAHVHEQPCGVEDGGAHFRFDETQPFAEGNEIWPYFTSSAAGSSGRVVETSDRRAGPRAVSVVVHDPDNPARRIGCADLGPDTADLAYHWDLGDGTTSREADPVHVYARPGTYTARLTVTRPHTDGHTGDHESVTRTVRVRVGARVALTDGPRGTTRSTGATFRFTGAEVGTFLCRLDEGGWRGCDSGVRYSGLADGRHTLAVRTTDQDTDPTPATRTWTVDTTGPTVGVVAPTGRTAARRPTVRARLQDRWSAVRPGTVTLRVDGRLVAGPRYDAATGQLRGRPAKALSPGRHRARVVAADSLGNRTAREWTFRVTR
ncbi:PKD domain-containing protein [uncultured Nocardioides sp.]|uniref:PKD domain-containing protein n=1 Tax=uncultured Nocardioides sp. TaxID=198441 RepID=UPI00262B1F1E|nr:PKD domain-containing protein [uncultured Nocardioides sp.]